MAQHMEALRQANVARLYIAKKRTEVRHGETTVQEILRDRDPRTSKVAVSSLLGWQHGWGDARCRKFCSRLRVRETRQIGLLTDRQVEVICKYLPTT